jgi:hypothetical protein
MATKRPAKPRRTLLQEAADPATKPERLRQLAQHKKAAVHQVALRNPSLPKDLWREALLNRWPEVWANPMAPIYLLMWAPLEEDQESLDEAARWATLMLWREPKRCSPEGKALLAANVQTWWATCESARHMVVFLGWWVNEKGDGSEAHKEVLHLLVLCIRTAHHLTDNDRQALNFLEALNQGDNDVSIKDLALVESEVVKDACRFALDPSYYPWRVIDELLKSFSLGKQVKERKEARAEHERLLADTIRQEMPLPPVVD